MMSRQQVGESVEMTANTNFVQAVGEVGHYRPKASLNKRAMGLDQDVKTSDILNALRVEL